MKNVILYQEERVEKRHTTKDKIAASRMVGLVIKTQSVPLLIRMKLWKIKAKPPTVS
jgi:hypothetical protein